MSLDSTSVIFDLSPKNTQMHPFNTVVINKRNSVLTFVYRSLNLSIHEKIFILFILHEIGFMITISFFHLCLPSSSKITRIAQGKKSTWEIHWPNYPNWIVPRKLPRIKLVTDMVTFVHYVSKHIEQD